jgi:hypothetical protein
MECLQLQLTYSQAKMVKVPNSKVSKYDHNIMTCVCVCVYNTFIVFIQTINIISKSKF